jgi:Group II intron, maturase-specific domain/HNH endonuclease
VVPKVLIPKNATEKYHDRVQKALAPNTHKESVKTKIMALNRLTNGWCQYYRIASNSPKVFNKLNYELFWKMAHWLGRKWELSMPKVMKKYYANSTFEIKTSKMALPSDHKVKKLLTKTWHNPYTAKEAIARERLIILESLWSGNEYRQRGTDIRKEVIAAKGTICAINGPDCESKGTPLHPSEVEVDHIILRARFKNPKDADHMKNLQVLCTKCHRAKTKNDLKVLSRMR